MSQLSSILLLTAAFFFGGPNIGSPSKEPPVAPTLSTADPLSPSLVDFYEKLNSSASLRDYDLVHAAEKAREVVAIAEEQKDEDFILVAVLHQLFIQHQLAGPQDLRRESIAGLIEQAKLSKNASPELQLHLLETRILFDLWSNEYNVFYDTLLQSATEVAADCDDEILVARQRSTELFIRVFRLAESIDSDEIQSLYLDVLDDTRNVPNSPSSIVAALFDFRVARISKDREAETEAIDRAIGLAKNLQHNFYLVQSLVLQQVAAGSRKAIEEEDKASELALEAAEHLQSGPVLQTALVRRAAVERKLRNYDKRVECLERVLDSASFKNSPFPAKDSLTRQLVAAYEAAGHPEKAKLLFTQTKDLESLVDFRDMERTVFKLKEHLGASTSEKTGLEKENLVLENKSKASALENNALKQKHVALKNESQASIEFLKRALLIAGGIILVLIPWLILYAVRHRLEKVKQQLKTSQEDSEENRQRCADLAFRVSRMERTESLGLMAGCIAHDFNNILVGVLCNAEVLQLGDRLDDKQFVYQRVEAIVKSAEKAANLSTQMLAYAGRQVIERKELDFNELILQYHSLLQSACRDENRLVLDLSDEPILAKVDATQFEQVILNLVTNAHQASSDSDGMITVRTGNVSISDAEIPALFGLRKIGGDFSYVEVVDEGIGISEANRQRIFEPFFSQSAQGRGLGLSVVFGVINRHDGFVSCVSNETKGTTFRALFPLQESTEHKTQPVQPPNINFFADLAVPTDSSTSGQEQSANNISGEGQTVLVVDDEESVLELCRQSLHLAGWNALTARNGDEALDQLREHGDSIGCVLMDVVMPKMGANEVLAEVEKMGLSTPFVLMSGFSSTKLEFFLSRSNVVSFLQKPFRISKVQSAMKQAISSRPALENPVPRS